MSNIEAAARLLEANYNARLEEHFRFSRSGGFRRRFAHRFPALDATRRIFIFAANATHVCPYDIRDFTSYTSMKSFWDSMTSAVQV
jgi:hypothetical protein